jgi:M6 family metalloprotease-like protein
MKILCASLLLILLIPLLFAAPLRNVPTKLTQPDGSVFACFMTGDEYYHRAHDADGYTIIKDPDSGWFVYAQRSGTDLVPTSLIPGRDFPAARGLTPNLLPDESILRDRFQNFRGASGDEYGRAPTTGTINNLCIFIRFAGETEFSDATQLYNDMHNSTTQASMYGYFMEESSNQLSVSSTFYPTPPGSMVISYQDPNPRNYYYPQSAGNPIGYPAGPISDPDMYGYIRLHTMLVNAVNFVATMIPPTLNIDADNDMSVDNLSFICRGTADAASAIFWPHYWVLDAYPATPLTYLNYMGMPRQADDYNFSLQLPDPLYTGYGGGIDAAEICHEFSHTLGFPDLYHYTWDGVNPCGYWDLMDTCYQVPQHHLTYMKWKYGGWFTSPPPMLPASGTCTLNAVAYNPFDCYRYMMPTGEEIWIEYRRAVGYYETRLPGSGLLVYRVDQAYSPWGNAGGPPDEVYVYRPYVSTSPPDGNINWAQYAWEQAHSAINIFTDPNPFSQNSPGFVAPLNIYSVGSNTGPQISFETGGQVPVIWTGAVDNNWFTPGNWTTGAVPVATDFVLICQGLLYSNCDVPLTPFGMPAVCQTLRNEYQLTIWPGALLQVGGNMTSIGRIFIDGTLQVAGNLSIFDWYAGSWFMCQNNPGAQIILGGNCLFETSTNIQLTVGQLIFSNVGVSPPVCTFTCDAVSATIFDWVVNRPGQTVNFSSMIPFPPLFVNGSLNVMANSTLIINSPRFIFITGNITVVPTGVLQVPDPYSTISLTGPPGLQAVSIANPTSYVNHLDINNNANPMLVNNINIRGDLTINSGALSALASTISIWGNWINNVGAGGFQKGTSRVVFSGPVNDQSITVATPTGALFEDFYTLELNKALGSLNMNTSGQFVQCDFYDWTSGLLKVTDGQFTALSLSDGYIAGNLTCNSPGVINLTDTVGNGDLGANLQIQGGTININVPSAGPTSVSTWGVLAGSLLMGSGQLRFNNTGVNIVAGAVFTSNVSGGIIEVAGDFVVQRPEFAPTGGVVWLNGSTTANIGTVGGGSFWDLRLTTPTVNTSTAVQVNGSLLVDTGCALAVSNPLTVNGSMTLDGSMSLSSPAVLSIGSGIVNGTLVCNQGSTMRTGTDIAVTGTGILQTNGVAGNTVVLRGFAGGYWKMDITGTIRSVYTDFLDLKDDGVRILSAGTVDPAGQFTNCSFSNGQSGNCTFLTVNNGQNLNLSGISLVSGGGETYNIAKLADTGRVTVSSSSGSFAGPLYENDPYARIDWVGYDPNLIVMAFTVSDNDPYVADQVSYTVTVKNESANPVQSSFNIHLFKNRSSAPGWGESGDYSYTCPTLQPGESYNHTFIGVYSMTAESWTSWLLIDPEGAVQETDETDNRDSESLTWQGLPAVSNMAVSTSGRLSWTYPIWATRYKVYDSDDPYGTFSYLGSTTNTYFDVSLTQARRFYRVQAERDAP